MIQPTLLNHSESPTVFLVDRTGRLVHSPPPGRMAEWRRIAPSVERLLAFPERDGSRALVLQDQRHSLRLLPVDGSILAVIVDTLRDPIAAIADRYHLTRREREVALCLLDGSTTAEIAERLGIAPATAVLHVKRLLAKTGSRTRVDFVVLVAGLRNTQ
jgi:DNA-binding CsgD family transcriptional regulator